MQAVPSIPRSATWETLQKSRNLAAIATLATGLDSENARVRFLSLSALIHRKEPAARRAVIMSWERYSEDDKDLLRKEGRHLVEIAQDLLAGGSISEKRIALTVIAELDLSESVDVVLDIVVNQTHALCAQATTCLLSMCERWGALARDGRSSPSSRAKLLEQLYSKIATFHEHKNLNLIDAWLCLAHWDDSAQRGLVSDPRQDAYRSVLKRLRHGERKPILQLLAGYLVRNATPKSIVEILQDRPEPQLAIEIAKLLDESNLNHALKRLRQLPELACLKNWNPAEHQVPFELEKKLWLMLAASSMDVARVLAGALKLSKAGTLEGRQAAAEVLRNARKHPIEELVPAIQASQINFDQEPNLSRLIDEVAKWGKSPSLTLQKAATEFLSDFTLENLLEQVRHWPTQMCRAMAKVVAQRETEVEQMLSQELQSPAPKRRLAALQVTEMLECTDKVSEWLMPLLDDSRLEVRVRVIDLLGALGNDALELMIPRLLDDASTDIQDAANRALRRLNRRAAGEDVLGEEAASL